MSSTFNKYRLKGAYHYDWYETEDWYKWLVDRCVKFCKGKTVDIGCGDGLLSSKFKSTGYSMTGLDKDPDAIRVARANNKLDEFIEFDIDKGAFLWKFEYLASINAIEHFNSPENVRDIIKHNITKGAIIITIDYQGGKLGEDHKFEWTYDQMMDFFKEFNPKGFRYKDTEWIGVEITK